MEKDKLKLELLQKIIACENEVILKKVEELLFGVSEAGFEKISICDDLQVDRHFGAYLFHLSNISKPQQKTFSINWNTTTISNRCTSFL